MSYNLDTPFLFFLLHQQIYYLCHVNFNCVSLFPQESYRQVMKMRPKDLWKRLMVKFRGEEGLDYGGVARYNFYTHHKYAYFNSEKVLNNSALLCIGLLISLSGFSLQ